MVLNLGHVMFSDLDDFLKHTSAVNDCYYFGRNGIIDSRPEKFPAFFGYVGPHDSHFMGYWHECSSIDMIDSIKARIDNLQGNLDEIFLALTAKNS